MNYPTFEELYRLIPENLRYELENCIQDPLYHKEGSVTNHMRLVFDQLQLKFSQSEYFLLLSLAVIFHDIAKPETRSVGTRSDGTIKIQHLRHETVCLKYISDLFPKFVLKFPEIYGSINIDDLNYICAKHMIAHVWRETQEGKSTIKKNRPHWKEFESHSLYTPLMMFAEYDEKERII